MDILITHGGLARTRSMHLRPIQLWMIGLGTLLLMTALSGLVYHFVFLTAVRENWPVVSQLVRPILRDEVKQRERYTRDNLDAMARKVGEMQAKLIRLEAVSDRVSGLAGLKPEELKALDDAAKAGAEASEGAPSVRPAASASAGGPMIPVVSPSFEQLDRWVEDMGIDADFRSDVFTMVESRLLERKLGTMMIPSIAPVDGPVGSGFGFRYDPFNSRPALHTGLDFPAPTGTPIRAAAAGKVSHAGPRGAYGNALEIEHGNGLMTRYAHNSAILVSVGDVIKRGQTVARVGSTGRSTGPHLHFEVMLNGVHQNPSRFLALGEGRGDLSSASVNPPAAAGGSAAVRR